MRHGLLALAVSGVLGFQLLAVSKASADKRGRKVAEKVDNAWEGYGSERFKVKLQLISAKGKKVTRKIRGKQIEDGKVEKMLLAITWPADQKGIKLLTWGRPNKSDDQWLYLPSIQRVKRISSRGRSGSFLGSEFAYEDLISPWEVEKYKYKFLREQKVGKFETWVVERYPKDRDSGYSKQVVWFDKNYLSALRIDYYDRKGKLLKTATLKDFNKYKGRWRADRIDMKNRQTGRKSVFRWTDRDFGVGLSEDDFSPDALEF